MGKYLTSEAFLKIMTKRVARGYRLKAEERLPLPD